jgi:electron transport complex protein RnfB
MDKNSYKKLAERLDALPNGFPATDDGAELRLLAKLFSPEEADLASQLRMTIETPQEIAERIGGDARELRKMLKSMAKQGLIKARKGDHGLAYGLLPFVVGIYEYQLSRLDNELAELFEDYYQDAFGQMVSVRPHFHRVLPVNETIEMGMEVHPYESVISIIDQSHAWGVMDCICRKQKALLGDPCEHPIDVCMVMSSTPGAFDHSTTIHSLTKDKAIETLQRAAKAGLVHTVSNNQEGVYYICNCCTCACGILRGLVEFGIANVVAKSAFVNQVDESRCVPCQICMDYCQFDAITINEVAHIDENRCVGCGVCVLACPEGAMSLIRRPAEEITIPPVTEEEWRQKRAIERGIDLHEVL